MSIEEVNEERNDNTLLVTHSNKTEHIQLERNADRRRDTHSFSYHLSRYHVQWVA